LPQLDAERLTRLIAAFIDPARLRLEGVSVGPSGHRLGGFLLDPDAPRFTATGGQSGALTRASWFRREAFAMPPSGAPALAAVLHVADVGEDGEPDERLVGWVPAAQEEDLVAWLAALNGELVELLEARRDHTPERAEFHDAAEGPSLPGFLTPPTTPPGRPRLRLVEPPE